MSEGNPRTCRSLFRGRWGTVQDLVQLDLTENGTASITRAEVVSGDYFQTLGVQAATGRTIEPSDERPGSEAVAVLSYAYWQGALVVPQAQSESPSNSTACRSRSSAWRTQASRGLRQGTRKIVWLPLSQLVPLRLRWGRGTQDERNWWLTIVGRLKPGISQEQAQSNVSLLVPAMKLSRKNSLRRKTARKLR